MDPITTGALIAGGGQLVGNVVGAITGNNQQKKARQWQEKMWHMQNEYNTPTQQMQRLKDAGLNPHLVYGNGANVQAGPVGSPPPTQPTPDYGSAFATAQQAYVTNKLADNQLKQGEADLLIKQEQLKGLQEDNVFKGLNNVDKQTEMELKNIDLEVKTGTKLNTIEKSGLENEILKGNLETQKAQLGKIIADTLLSTDQLATNELNRQHIKVQIDKTSQDIVESTERIKTMLSTRNLMGLEAQLKQISINLRQTGFQENDNAIIRILGSSLGGAIKSLDVKNLDIQMTNKINEAIGNVFGDNVRQGVEEVISTINKINPFYHYMYGN